jgi:TrmH family RNA methyltransferase
MEPLTASNTRVKEARKLSRRSVRSERRLMLVEGWKAIEAARDLVVEVFATPAAAAEHQAMLAPYDVTLVDDRALTSLTDAVSPQGLVAVCRAVDVPLEDAVTAGVDSGLLVMCADVRDPGNAGTVVRTADAVGAGAVVLAGDSVDVANPKTLRASVGSVFHLPVAVERDPVRAVLAARAAGLTVLAADGAGEVDLLEADPVLEGPTAWLFGNEAWGLPGDLAAAADHRVRIPILGRAESLNLATAAAVCLYASARVRQRAAAHPGGTAPA